MDLEIYILAGGKSSRMGIDKGLLEINGKPMIQYLIEAIIPLPYSVHIIAHHSGYSQFGLGVISDQIPEKGPLGGLYTALCHTRKSKVCLLSCDMPFLKTATVDELISRHPGSGITASQLKGRLYPFPGIYPTSLSATVRAHLENNKLKISSFIFEHPHKLVSLDHRCEKDSFEFTNINLPADLNDATSLLSGR